MTIKKPYLLTGGLVPLIENRHRISLSEPTRESLRSLEKSYFGAASALLNGREEKDESGNVKYIWDVQFIPDEVISNNLGNLIENNRTNKPLISFDDVYCQDKPEGNYHVTRIQDPNKLDENPELGPRFATPELEVQVADIKERYGKEIDVMDIGVFGGDTLAREIKRFKDGGVKIGNIYVMFAGQEGIDRIANEGSDLKYVQKVDWIDWLEMRDCIGFDGRKVRMKPGKNNPENLFVRYIERSAKWASIPEDVKHHYEGLYHSSFDMIKSILACDGIVSDLKQSADHNQVYELRLKKK